MHLLILGASVRAAAFSALRAGLRPTCGDLFADADLGIVCPAHRVEPGSFPEALDSIADAAPAGPWLYTGALENHPELVDRIAARRPLWGLDGTTLRAVRDPLEVARVLRRAGLPCLSVQSSPEGLPGDGSWLVKPRASAGGRRIRPWTGSMPPPCYPVYYQQRMVGIDGSAVFLASGGGARLLGLTHQWIGTAEEPFAYRGSLGPWSIEPEALGPLERTGQVLAAWFGLRGLFGVDLVLDQGIAWPVEVNPRYTASVEVLEYALGRSLLAEHAAVFDPGREFSKGPEAPRDGPCFVGKATLFAHRAGQVPSSFRQGLTSPVGWSCPPIADCPSPGTCFRAGDPLFTVLAQAPTLKSCAEALSFRHQTWQTHCYGWTINEVKRELHR